MDKKRILKATVAAIVILSIGLIASAVINGKYLEAIATSGIISTLAWFALQKKTPSRQKTVVQNEQVEEREE